MNKLIKVSLFACLLFIGLAKIVRADSFTTFTTTAVTLSTASDIELLEMRVGTGTPTYGENYVIVADSRPLVLYSTGGNTGILLEQADYTVTKFPPSQWVIPPIIAIATPTSVSNLEPSGQTVVKLQGVDGNGITILNGLTIFTVGKDDLVVSVRYRRKPQRSGK